MKKIVVLLAAMSLLAGSAFAQITNTAHDLSSGSTGSASASTTDEICVFCHTPHGANLLDNAPLWNRTSSNATSIYSATAGGTLDATITTASVNLTDAPLCLSCHDGSSLGQALQNPPNAALTAGETIGAILGVNANLGNDLSNDHPVGFNYATVAGIDTTGIRALATATGLGVNFYGGTSQDMWCSSCHDVHDNSYSPFLLKANTGSALCLACHIK